MSKGKLCRGMPAPKKWRGGVYWGYIGIMENKNGNYYSILGLYRNNEAFAKLGVFLGRSLEGFLIFEVYIGGSYFWTLPSTRDNDDRCKNGGRTMRRTRVSVAFRMPV